MSSRRRSILSGASVVAICVAAPVTAQTVPVNGGALLPNPLTTATTDTYAGGVTATGANPTAKVNNLANGEVAQVSETATGTSLTNGGTIAVAADARGTGTATASVGNVGTDVLATGAYQSAVTQKHLLGDVDGATWDASASLVNTGTARVRAIAQSADGDASATVIGGIAQTASVETKGRRTAALMDNRSGGTVEVGAAARGVGVVAASVGIGGESGAPAVRQFVFSAKSPDATTNGSGSILNAGTILVTAAAEPLVAGTKSATAKIAGGIVQQVQATGRGNSALTATINNSHTMTFNATAGVGPGTALTSTAFATEVLTQRVQANGGGLKTDPTAGWNDEAPLSMANSGAINLATNATAVESATSLIGVKLAPADFGQYAILYPNTYGPNGVGVGTNNAYLLFDVASPILSEHGVISQRGQANGWGDDKTLVTFTNAAGGSINVTAGAAATNPGGNATARNAASGLIVQKTQANGTGNDTATADLTNQGAISANLTAKGAATNGNAMVVSTLTNAVQQVAEVTGPTKYRVPVEGGGTIEVPYVNTGELSFTNGATGVVDLRSAATASAANGLGEAHAYVDAGLLQTAQVDGGAPVTSFNNGNRFKVAATSVASGNGAFASAGTANVLLDAGFPVDEGRLPTPHDVVGVSQLLIGKITDARFTNSGALDVVATATANGAATGADALSSAVGYRVTGEPVGIKVTNSSTGTVTVSATATTTADKGAPRLADARATGMGFYANYEPLPEMPDIVHGGESDKGGGKHPPSDVEETPAIPTYALTGTVANAGTIAVSARSSGDARLPADGLILPGSIVAGQTPSIGATAVGVEFVSASNNVAMRNTGTIDVSSVTTGAPARATGALVSDYANIWGVQAAGTDLFTLSNLGGTIRARTSTNDGALFKHGTAIDTSGSPNKAIINLEGATGRNGYVYGNIDIAAGDAVHVRNGETTLDGVINPGGPLDGSLAIHSGGSLYLVNQPHGAVSTTGTPTVNPAYDGPAGAVVNSFAMDTGSKLALQLPSFPASEGSYPTIVANTATLGAGSAMEIRRSSWNGLYANRYYFNNVIKAANAGALSFDPANRPTVAFSSPTPLLNVTALYNLDVSGGDVDIVIHRVAFGALPGLTPNQAATGNGIEQVYSPTLTGPFAGLLGNLFLLNETDYRDALTQLSGDQYAGYLQGLRNQSAQINNLVSGQLDCAVSIKGLQDCRKRDGRVRIWGHGLYSHVSVDGDGNAPGYHGDNWSLLLGADYTTGNFTVGAFGGYRDTKVQFTRNEGRIKADGWQLGLMAAYDTGLWYGRVIGSYSDLNAHSTRVVNVLTNAGTISGRPDTKVASLYGEAGRRIQVGPAWLTPFAALDFARVKLDGFTETGVPGADLAFARQSENRTSLLAGMKWSATVGSIVPEAKLAWRHDFDHPLFGVDAGFADAPAGSFRVFAPQTARDTIVAGASIAAVLGERFTGRIGYQGRFASHVNDHAVYGSLIFRFGGAN